jgi:RimJ/RimL family protein N-acetyltransferase
MGVEQSSPDRARIVLDDEFVLDRPRVEDAAAHRRFALDPEAARFLGWSVDQARLARDSHYVDVVHGFIRQWDNGTRFSFAIRRVSTGEAVGTVELRPRPVGHEADVSYLVAPELRGRGLAPRAVTAALAWAGGELGLRRATIHCDVANASSQRVAEKCGFEPVGRFGDELRFHRDLAPPNPEGLRGLPEPGPPGPRVLRSQTRTAR